ncbi:MAG: pyruvate:ferredoxin (flavodoxin) oxidoreductase [Eubacteriaceae bacterium]|nr:pyruvate:ferredoxin (flavodoxin) oxidoreductase [Eubacteriaceae bacterium]
MGKNMKTMDGNTAAANAAYAFTEVAAIYPITPSSTMAELVDEWSAGGKKNIFDRPVIVSEMQSEGGAAGALHGSLSAGALTTTFTASQGLLLMIPNMYKLSGELLPAVFHVSARAVAGHALSIFGDHSDVMAARQTGFAMIASGNVQEIMDLAGLSHLCAIESSLPFLHFFDGFRTSHEIQKIETIDYSVYEKLLNKKALSAFRQKALNPDNPFTKGSAQNPDIYFQAKESANKFYDELPDIVDDYMGRLSEYTGRRYHPFDYYGDPRAEKVIVAMGSVCDAIKETVDYLNEKGEKTGLISVHLYRPFSIKYLMNVLPQSVKKIAVLDRTKEAGAAGQPLYLDIVNALGNMKDVSVVGGIYGLGSKDTTPSQIKAVFDNLENVNPKNNFTIGITDDVTLRSLEVTDSIDTVPAGTVSCKFWGLGSDGTVGANKSAIKIIGDNTDMYAQGYFAYDSKKSGGVTISHLRFGPKPITSSYYIEKADFVSCSAQSYIGQYDMTCDVKPGGVFLLNTAWDLEELTANLPGAMKRDIVNKNIEFYTIDADGLAGSLGLGRKINMIMQSAFFKLAAVIPYEEAEAHLKDEVVKNYGKKGQKVIDMNYAAIDGAISSLKKVTAPPEWAEAKDAPEAQDDAPEFVKKILRPVNRQQGDKLPVSAFTGLEDGRFPAGSAAYEKRMIATDVPVWDPNKCLQCNQCSLVCPHAAIRPILVTSREAAEAPEGFVTIPAKGKGYENYTFRIQISPMDCEGCGSCAVGCTAKDKALTMRPIEETLSEAANWDYAVKLPEKMPENVSKFTVKGSQFKKPLLEFSGACAGCGETPYAKLVTQLFGDRMYIANATGCSSIWGASAPSTPYTKNDKGKGPAWANSLFEDNAEYGYGMFLAVKAVRDSIKQKLEELCGLTENEGLKNAAAEWIATMQESEESEAASLKLAQILKETKLEGYCGEIKEFVLENERNLSKKSMWIFGGDGWAYDIGYGGLDHVLAQGEDVNILVFDTEVYSNTGGQSSKSTPEAAVAKFAAQGKRVKKKDLGMMAMAYGYVYVAQVAMGANQNQLIKALKEAEAYHGPSLIICYCPCINHGIKGGMGGAMQQMKKAVQAGYWHLYRYNPLLEEKGENPFILDSKAPSESFRDFLNTETRYTSLALTFPEVSEGLFERCEQDAKARYEKYAKLAEG